MAKPDLTYSSADGIWTRFYPETDAGEDAWQTMAKADPQGAVAFLASQVPGVLLQLRQAGYVVRKARPCKPMTPDELDAMLSEIGG